MIAICLLLILATQAEDLESREDTQPTHKVTTLYPVPNKTDPYTHTTCENESESQTVKEKSKTDATTWKLEAAFGEANLDDEEDGNITKVEEGAREVKNVSKVFKPSQPLGSFVDEEALSPAATESYEPFTPMFKQTASGFVSVPKHHYTTYEKPKEIHKEIPKGYTEFPYKFEKAIYTKVKGWSPDILESKPTAEVPVRVPGIYERPGSHRHPVLDDNTDIYKVHELHGSSEDQGYPGVNGNTEVYRFPDYHGSDDLGYPKDNENPGVYKLSSSHGKPGDYGVPSVYGVPAGGLYKLTDPFNGEPGVISVGDYGWEHHGEVVENHVKKRVNPLKNLLHLITAFLPVGLIISALTPSVITIHNSGDKQQAPNLYRRSDTAPDVAPISERCRRRLLCELQSDANYRPHQKGKRKHCYKIYCEDTQAVWRLLHWLLTRHKSSYEDHGARSIT